MRLTTYGTATGFVEAVRPSLGEHEAEHHLVLGVAEAAARGRATSDELFAATVDDASGLALAALMTNDRPLLVASNRADVSAPSALVWEALAAHGQRPRFVIGAVGQIEQTAAEWQRRHDREPQVFMRQRVYRLTHVESPPATSGEFRSATSNDVDLLTEWTAVFESEALAGVAGHSSRAAVERRIDAGEMYLWCDPEPRTMAASARPTRRAIAVNAVYTPAQWRRRGYASACVAALSARLLEQYEFCVLYTDLSNATSNAIYTRIGYRPVRDSVMYELPW